ncbi:Phosphotransferase system mannitol/fructose-specific IIA domain (Ntr-type) [Treponema sp. JC4]|uniref:PTS sugar transporter subunit IIA n=1 Tax=Treponema sp. JC4 TaxID=1124982 RepID=UPI00025B0BFF|nr:PTS sugar transporter subunit IIA [Treponema sp. JC4]EID85576.1 Phosphotransferase system mannitol/fructose-specific IIA domain (Ntr-type) [Treponema sp. JC4]
MLTDYITPSDINLNLESTDKEEAFAELTEMLVKKCPGLNRTEYMKAVTERENKCSTAVFPKVAVPHAVCDSASKTTIVVGISHDGIEFEPLESADNTNPVVNIIFQIVFERENTGSHLNVLRDILYIVSKPEFYEKILTLKTQKEIFDLFTELEY